ncbi:MAG: hypothetical protein WAW23_12785 [Candidatus Methanoperedens sp.]
MDHINNREVEPVAHVPDDDKVDNICHTCGADLFVVGVIEVLLGGYSEAKIHFENGEVKPGATETMDFNEQRALCGKCRGNVEHTAIVLIDAFKELYPPKVRDEIVPLLTIEVKAPILPESMERLEDSLRDFLISKGIEAVIESTLTGNTTVAKGRVVG